MLTGAAQLALAAALAASGTPASPGDAMIAAKICTRVERDLGSTTFERRFAGAACEHASSPIAERVMRRCLIRETPGTEAWRRCIDSGIVVAAKAIETGR